MYANLGYKVRNWEDLQGILEENSDSHHVYRTTDDYQQLNPGVLGDEYPFRELYRIDTSNKTFEVYTGVVISVCKALGWTLPVPPTPHSPQETAVIFHKARENIHALLNPNNQRDRKGRTERDRLRVLKEIVEAEIMGC